MRAWWTSSLLLFACAQGDDLSTIRVIDGGIQVTDGGTQVTDGGTQVTDGGTQVTDGGTQVTDGGTQVTDGGTQVTDGGTRVTDGGVMTIDGGVMTIDGGVMTIDGGVMTIDGGASPPAVDAATGGDAGPVDTGLADASSVDAGAGSTLTITGLQFSLRDRPKDGVADLIDAVFPTFVLMTNAQEDRAYTEFDLSALGGRPVRDARVTGGIAVNNALAVGVRQFHILTYEADGVAALSDFDLPGTVTATTAYDPPNTTGTTFIAPVTTAVNTLLSRGVTHLGIRVQCVAPITCAANVLSPVPELVVTP